MTEEVIQLSIPNFPVSLKKKLEALAEQDQRKLAAYLRIVLAKHVQAIEAFELAEKSPTPTAA